MLPNLNFSCHFVSLPSLTYKPAQLRIYWPLWNFNSMVLPDHQFRTTSLLSETISVSMDSQPLFYLTLELYTLALAAPWQENLKSRRTPSETDYTHNRHTS